MSNNKRNYENEGMATKSNGERMAKGLEDCLLELLDQSTTPEKALQTLSSPYFLSGDYNKDKFAKMIEVYQSIEGVIFLAYFTFIITRLPEACVDGIWEDMLSKTVKYSPRFHGDEAEVLTIPLKDTKGLRVGTWLDEALSTPSKCPNPYVRLELFHLINLFHTLPEMNQERVCTTFIHTICEIEPHHLYPTGNIDDMSFGINDMRFVLSHCHDRLQNIISNDVINQLKENNQINDNSNGTKFLCNCIKIVGIFACVAGSYPDRNERYHMLRDCLSVFGGIIGSLVNCGEYLPRMSIWMQFRYITKHPPFRGYVLETTRELTRAIFNHKCGHAKTMMMCLRDMIVEDLSADHNNYTLPGLLISRQVEGPKHVHQHSLLLKRLLRMYGTNATEYSEFKNDLIQTTSGTLPLPDSICDTNLDRWTRVYNNMPCTDYDSDKSSSSDNLSLFSSSDDSSDESVNIHNSLNSDSSNDDY